MEVWPEKSPKDHQILLHITELATETFYRAIMQINEVTQSNVKIVHNTSWLMAM